MPDSKLFPEGFGLDESISFKAMIVNADIPELASFQSALIELMQGFTNCASKDNLNTLFLGLEVLKMFMLNYEQLEDLKLGRKMKIENENKSKKNSKDL